jgi:inosine-uridine nucleoside N-ribohydrolase
MGPLSNLADVLTARPRLSDVLEITQMGGALNYRHPDLAEHNVRLDVTATRTVLAGSRRLSFVISDVTFRPDEMALTAEGVVYRHLLASHDLWARMLRAHLDRWYAGFYPATLQHDPLTLSAAVGLPFVDFALKRISMDQVGRMSLDTNGLELFLSSRADYAAFTRWLHKGLGISAGRDASDRGASDHYAG